MSTEPSVRDLLGPLTEHTDELTPRRLHVDREKIVSRMVEVSLTPEPRLSRSVKLGMALALAASFALAAWGGLAALGRSEVAAAPQVKIEGLQGKVVAGGRPIPLGRSVVVVADGSLQTSKESSARIESDGMQLTLEQDTTVSLRELGVSKTAAALRLDRGRVRCAIPHDPARTFAVITADARVVDIGTVFSVAVVPSDSGPKTAVQVEEGEVMVEHAGQQVRLRAPASWTSAPPSAAVALEPAPVPVDSIEPAPPAKERRDVAPGKRRADTLQAETKLLQAGLASEQRGDFASAARDFEQLVKRYPASPLAPDARAALARVKGRLASPK